MPAPPLRRGSTWPRCRARRPEAELRARRGDVSLTASAEQVLLAYVAASPGVTIKETIHARPARLTYRSAEAVVRGLLREGRLLADPPQTRSSDTRLYVADDSENRL